MLFLKQPRVVALIRAGLETGIFPQMTSIFREGWTEVPRKPHKEVQKEHLAKLQGPQQVCSLSTQPLWELPGALHPAAGYYVASQLLRTTALPWGAI